jgi:hypothetical protein
MQTLLAKFRNNHPSLSRLNVPLIVIEILTWFFCVGVITFLWNRWLIPGPYGPVRWIGMDFAPYWVGVQQMIHGVSPYSAAATLKIQQAVYGGAAANVDPMMFVYPAYMFLLIAPFGYLPLNWAVALFAGTLTWGLINLILMLAFQWSGVFSRRILLGIVLTLGSLPFFVISVSKGQVGYLCMGALFIAWRLWNRKPFWSGALLSLAILKPTDIIIPVIGYLLWSLWKKNFHALVGFLCAITILAVASFLAIGNWIPAYFDVLKIGGGAAVIWSLSALAFPWNFLYSIFIAGVLIYAISIALKKNESNLWMSTFTLAGIAFFPMRWIYDLFLGLLIPSQEKDLSPLPFWTVSLALLSSWSLILIPESSRWSFAATAIPSAWALCTAALTYNHNQTSNS